MKKIFAIIFILGIAVPPLTTKALPLGGTLVSQSISAETAAYASSRAADAIGVPIFSEALAKIAGFTAGDTTQGRYEWLETFLKTTLKKALLDRIVDQIIDSIQGGGKPQFVTDWRGFIEDAGQEAVGDLAKELGLGFLCSPFSFQIQLHALPVKKFSKQVECTLNQIIGNINAFYNDFRSGGWIAYNEAWQPQNNFFGSLLITAHETERRRGLAESAAQNEALAGGGFLSSKDKNGNIITPGSTVGGLVSKAVGSDIDFLLSAEQLGEYASAITNAIINRVIKEGVTSLQVATSRSREDAARTQYNQVIADNFNSIRNNLFYQIDGSVGPLRDTNALIDIAVINLTNYKADLQKLFNDFTNTGKLICVRQNFQQQDVDVTKVKQEITSEISQADATIANLLKAKSTNEKVIADLLTGRQEIEQLQPDNAGLSRLQVINNQIGGFADIPTAENFRNAMQTESNNISANISSKLATFNQQLTQCQQATP